MKFIFISCFLFVISCWTAFSSDIQDDQAPSSSIKFQTALGTFINGFNKGEGVIDNVLLIDFRKKKADEYFDSMLDRLNQMWKEDMLDTYSVLKDITLMLVYSDKFNPIAPDSTHKISENSRLSLETFLPCFSSVVLIDSTQTCEEGQTIQESNAHLKKILNYLKYCLEKKYEDVIVNWKKLGMKNARSYQWE